MIIFVYFIHLIICSIQLTYKVQCHLKQLTQFRKLIGQYQLKSRPKQWNFLGYSHKSGLTTSGQIRPAGIWPDMQKTGGHRRVPGRTRISGATATASKKDELDG